MPTEERVQSAALDLFTRKGFSATGVRDIARAAGISSASLYHYMVTKEDLLVAVTVRATDHLVEPGRHIHASGGSPIERLSALVRHHVIEHAHGQAVWQIADEDWRRLDEVRRAPIVALRDEYQSYWESAVEDGRAAGIFQCADTKLVTFGILAMCSDVYKWFRSGGRLAPDQIAGHYVDLALAMLQTKRPRAKRRRPASK